VEKEYERLHKFSLLDDPAILGDLLEYMKALRLYVKHFSREQEFPATPPSLTDENFYKL
jgi:hypothetical protein